MSERLTEDLFLKESDCNIGRNEFGYVYEQGDIKGIKNIEDALKQAGGKPDECSIDDFSKGGKGNAKSEFIVTFNNHPDTIIVVECKKNPKDHTSEHLNKPKKYATDGVLYYCKFLKKNYNVIAVALSGTKKENCNISTFYWEKGSDEYRPLTKLNIILSPDNYIRFIKGEKISIAYSLQEIRQTAIDMSNKLRVAKVTAANKPIFIAGILIALQDACFDNEYQYATNLESLSERLQTAISRVLKSSEVNEDRISSILSTFKDVASLHHFKTTPMTNDNSLRWYIQELDMKIKPMMNNSDSSIDALGEFYHEFIKFSNGDDGKALGIILTPQHLTEFMCDIAGINKNSKVIDICAGSGGFLVTAMSKMFKNANPEEIEKIRKSSLFGIEADPNIYTLCVANMIVRRDGKSNIHYGSCFDENILDRLRRHSIDVGLINPPYSQDDHNELEFLECLLSVLTTRGIAVAVVPINCALGNTCKQVRERLMSKHTLEAVFSIPTEIFNPAASAPPCVMVWTANIPHSKDKKTFFGYYRDDGYVKRKKMGRIDALGKWQKIHDEWIDLYNNKRNKPGLSVMHKVSFNDEWCAEAYMETDYSKLTETDFERKIKEYIAFNFLNGLNDEEA